ncbi:hypothetical protein B7463_g3737, partial [Scytalidium lignicola]
MKVLALLPLAAAATALVLPEGELLNHFIESQEPSSSFLDHLTNEIDDGYSHLQSTLKEAVAIGDGIFDIAIHSAEEVVEKVEPSFKCLHSMTAFDAQGWLDSALEPAEGFAVVSPEHASYEKPKHRSHHKSNKTIYELISSSKYTTKLAKLIDEYPDLVQTLNGTAANYTIFAPTDKAFEHIPHHGDHKPSKELIEKVLSYHISKEFYPVGRILLGHTIPTGLELDSLGGAQRLRVGLSLRGLTVNFYSKVLAANIFGSNGVIHAVDHILLPPPPALKIISLLPTEFSTLSLGLEKTGLLEPFSTAPHSGGTFFAPNNLAFKKLGPKINAFLFSKFGERFLKALLQYHVSVNQTLYSDAFYKAKGVGAELDVNDEIELDPAGFPKGHFRVDLPTLFGGKSLPVDIGRFGGLINIKVNGYTSVTVQDGLARDGVIQVVSSVLIPPKPKRGSDENYGAEEVLTVEDLIERLEPFVERDVSDEL